MFEVFILCLARGFLGGAANGYLFTTAGSGVGPGALAAGRQAGAMAQAAVSPDVLKPLDVAGNHPLQLALNGVVISNGFL